jgi:hypothetical protein
MALPTARKSIADQARRFVKSDTSLSILEFAESKQGIGEKLLPAQRFVLKVMEKEALDDEDAYIPIRDQFNRHIIRMVTEHGFYKMLREEGRFSMDYDVYVESQTVQFQFCMGRRASKTTMVAIWVAYQLYKILNIAHPQAYFGIMSQDPMSITMTALGEESATKLFARLANIINKAPFFRRYLLEPPGQAYLRLWTQNDLSRITDTSRPPTNSNSITVRAATNSPALRGDNNLFVVADEFAHFGVGSTLKEKGPDEVIYEALAPSISGFKHPDGTPFGRALFLSSPNGKQGKFWKDFDDAFRLGPDSYTLAIQCATWEINGTIPPAFLMKEYNKSPASYEQEYGAKFGVGGVGWLRDLGKFYTSLDNRLSCLTPLGTYGKTYFLGLDFALSNDGTAATIAHWEPYYDEPFDSLPPEAAAYWKDSEDPENLELKLSDEGYYELFQAGRPKGRVVVDYTEVRYAGKAPYEHRTTLLLDDVLDWIGELFDRWPISKGVFDQWSGEIIRQMVDQRPYGRRLEMISYTQQSNDSMYKLFSQLLHEGSLKMPSDDPTLMEELLSLRVENKGKGMIKVEVPSSRGHDDRFDSLIRAVQLAYLHKSNNPVVGGVSLQQLIGGASTNMALAGADPRLVAILQKQNRPATATHNLRSRTPARMPPPPSMRRR